MVDVDFADVAVVAAADDAVAVDDVDAVGVVAVVDVVVEGCACVCCCGDCG